MAASPVFKPPPPDEIEIKRNRRRCAAIRKKILAWNGELMALERRQLELTRSAPKSHF